MLGRTLDGDFNRRSESSPTDDFVWGFTFGPSNDSFATPQTISGASGSVVGTTRNASHEVGEPLVTGHSLWPITVWYTWRPASDGWYTFDVQSVGSANFAIAAYTGSALWDLSEHALNYNFGSSRRRSRISFPARATVDYRLDVAGEVVPGLGEIADGSGDFSLRWHPTPPPIISTVSPARGSPGDAVTLNGTNLTGVTSVRFGGIEARFRVATNVNFLDLRLTVVVPAHASTGPITVEAPYGNHTTPDAFEVILPESPLLLTIEKRSAGALQVSGPTIARSFVLEIAESLAFPTHWIPVWTNPAAVALSYPISDVAGDRSRFFRAVAR